VVRAWSVIVHGGAKTIRPERQIHNRTGCETAAAAAQAVLEGGGSAIDAVEAAILAMEDDPTFNAGYGSVQNADGDIEMDAALMSGVDLSLGAIAAIRGVRHPISVAKALLQDKAVLLVGDGAARYAAEIGAELRADSPPAVPSDEACNTVGCVALDNAGRLAAGTSTGGLNGVRAGRVGDSPIPGCGLYAEDALGGVSFSGDGESILRLALAARIMGDLAALDVQAAVDAAIAQMGRVGGEAGCIALDPRGNAAFAHNSEHFAVGTADPEQGVRTFLNQKEFLDG
jgi:isoaspartyl peptidase/L-asparaginase-like protein (Ntn-hydrolase superfamily)